MSDADEDAAVLAREREAHMALLRAIPGERARLAEREQAAVHYARLLGIGWDEVGSALGMGAGEALERYGEPPADAEPF